MDTFDRNRVLALAAGSSLARVIWHDRGRAPIGYTKGMAVVYARVYQHFKEKDDPVAAEISKPLGNLDHDALAWYDLNAKTALDRLRSLFILMVGLGMRESGGNFGEGRDRSASNTTADTAEAGLFQMSWDIVPASTVLFNSLFKIYFNAAEDYGLGAVFHEGVRITEAQLANYGKGQGASFQKLAKAMPAFAAESAAIGLRSRRKHWGPVNRKEVEIRDEALELFKNIEAVVDATPADGSTEPVYVSKGLGLLQAFNKFFGG